MSAQLVDLVRRGALLPLDRHLALAAQQLAGGTLSDDVLLALALASRAVQRGHVCLDLPRAAGQPLLGADGEVLVEAALPPAEEVRAGLAAAGVVADEAQAEAGMAPGGARHPFVLDAAGRLYLFRYWRYQRRLAGALRARLALREPPDEEPPDEEPPDEGLPDEDLLAEGLARLFPPSGGPDGPDLQRQAARVAVERRFAVISGGPGTGKTSTVASVLVLLQEQARAAGRPPLRVELLAPTGKAAQRLGESLAARREALACDDEVRAMLPQRAATIHRALGYLPGTPTRFRHDQDRPLAADVVLVDEASMVDLALMAKLVDAVAQDARLLLMGDKDQLASVEAGAIFGDLCRAGIDDSVVHLTHSYRYRDDSGIGRLARAVNQGDVEATLTALRAPDEAELRAVPDEAALRAELRREVRRGFAGLSAREPAALLAALDRFRVLAVHRHGPRGVEALNAWIERDLHEAGVVAVDQDWYLGRPIMVTRNDYQLQLFNGDVGVVAEGEDGVRRAWFADGEGGLRSLLPARLPPHETVFAMTVHKSQGSEFDQVALVLPERPTSLLTRELVYTGITRARDRVLVLGGEAVLRDAVPRQVERASGLRDALSSGV